MMKLVRPASSLAIADWMSRSVCVSMLLVASSRIKIGGSATRARASDSNWRCPTDNTAAPDSTQRKAYDLVQHDSMKAYYGPLVAPGPKDDWETFARSTYSSYQHGVGTCMMGPASDPMAVVDSDLRVHGMENLWVADASIMPTVTHANTNVTAIMIGERVSDLIRATSNTASRSATGLSD